MIFTKLTAPILLVTAISASSVAQKKIDTTISIQGSAIGVNHYEVDAEGNFTSEVKISVGGSDIDSKAVGKYTGTVPVSLDYVNIQGGAKTRVLWDGKELTIFQNEKPNKRPIKLEDPLFGNFHPQLAQQILAKLDWSKKEAQTVKFFLIDGAVPFQLTLTPKETKTVSISGKNQPVKYASFKLATVEGEYAVGEDGTIYGMSVPAQKLTEIVKGAEAVFEDPMAQYPELSQSKLEVSAPKTYDVPMRDGTLLSTTVVAPKAPGKYPVILTRTPYDQKAQVPQGAAWAAKGYIFIAQDVRGTGASKGEWDPFIHERKDGYDTIDWISKQPWCDGNVGMIGGSYLGLVQWAAAVEKHPALKCIVPQVSPPPSAMMNLPYDNGMLLLMGDLWWLRIVDNPKGLNMAGAMGAVAGAKELPTLPLSEADNKVLGFNSAIFDRWLEREGEDKWPEWSFTKLMPSVKIPALHISGWWDGDGIGTKTNWELLRKGGNTNQWLIYGPWVHNFNASTKIGNRDFGPTAVLELDSLYVRWFDTWLKHKSVGLEKVPKVKAFVTGANKWTELTQWPDPKSETRTLNFQFGKNAVGPKSTGKLVSKLTEAGKATYTFDPKVAEVPKALTEELKENLETMKKRQLDNTQIYLESEPMTKDTALGGPYNLEFSFKTSAKDTDLIVSMFDVAPDGTMTGVGQPGKIRAAYLKGLDKPRPLTPDKEYVAKFDLWDSAHEFAKGHKIALCIQSSAFPGYARNLGTGEPIKSATKMIPQTNTLYSTPTKPGKFTFRVLW